jgi:hypothetical protein
MGFKISNGVTIKTKFYSIVLSSQLIHVLHLYHTEGKGKGKRVPVHAMKAFWVRRTAALIHNLGTR